MSPTKIKTPPIPKKCTFPVLIFLLITDNYDTSIMPVRRLSDGVKQYHPD